MLPKACAQFPQMPAFFYRLVRTFVDPAGAIDPGCADLCYSLLYIYISIFSFA